MILTIRRNTREDHKRPGICLLKNYVFILTCLTLVTFKVLPVWRNTPIETFFRCSKQFFNLLILMSFSASAVFYFTYSTLAKCYPLRTFFIEGGKKVTWSEIRWIGGWGTEVMLCFGQKLLNTQCCVGRCSCKSPIMKWAN